MTNSDFVALSTTGLAGLSIKRFVENTMAKPWERDGKYIFVPREFLRYLKQCESLTKSEPNEEVIRQMFKLLTQMDEGITNVNRTRRVKTVHLDRMLTEFYKLVGVVAHTPVTV